MTARGDVDAAVADAREMLKYFVSVFKTNAGMDAAYARYLDMAILSSLEGCTFAKGMRPFPTAAGVVHLAREGDPIADHVLRTGAAQLVADGKTVPVEISSYIAETICGVSFRKRGRQSAGHNYRNLILALCISQVSSKYGFDRTRNEATDDCDSACSIVVRALGDLGLPMITEETLNKQCAPWARALMNPP